MGEREREVTSKEGLVNESSKGLLSDDHESSEEKAPRQNTRGDALMAETAVKKRVSKKEKAKPKSVFLEALAQSRLDRARSMVLMRQVEELQAENEQLTEKEEHRKAKQRERAAKWRDSHPETHKERERERYRNRKAENQ